MIGLTGDACSVQNLQLIEANPAQVFFILKIIVWGRANMCLQVSSVYS